MNTSLEDQLDRIKALLHLTSVDVSSVLLVLEEFRNQLEKDYPNIASPTERFLVYRKNMFHLLMEQMEEDDPGLAGRIQELIDIHCTEFPLSYEKD